MYTYGRKTGCRISLDYTYGMRAFWKMTLESGSC
jgi:hypothetical protein